MSLSYSGHIPKVVSIVTISRKMYQSWRNERCQGPNGMMEHLVYADAAKRSTRNLREVEVNMCCLFSVLSFVQLKQLKRSVEWVEGETK
jgi:hypothetical protein